MHILFALIAGVAAGIAYGSIKRGKDTRAMIFIGIAMLAEFAAGCACG